MQTLLCIKILGNSSNGYLGLFKDFNTKQELRLSGNIPYIPNGSCISLDYEITETDKTVNVGIINDYDYPYTVRNIRLLGDKYDEFRKKCEIHHIANCLWSKIDNLENPYSYQTFPNADRIYRIQGGKATDRVRLDSLFETTRDTFRNKRKDTYNLQDYVEGVRDTESTGSFGYLGKECLIAELNGRFFCLSPDCKYVRDKEILRANQYIKDFMSIAESNTFRFKNEKDLDDFCFTKTNLSDEQKQAIKTLVDYQPVVVTGYAGTGKTTVIKSLIEASKLSDDDILLLAPTGKASRRMTESCGREAKTIHSALRKTPNDDFTFYNEKRRLPQKLIIVDECSMIDTLLMYDLLKAVSPSSKIFFIGDFHQLAPVGCGEPFFKFITENMCQVIKLTHIYRQNDGTILRNSQHILNNEPLENGDDFIIRHIKKDEICEYVNNITQVISPYNELNDYINTLVQERNDTPFISGTKLKIGDKVIGTVNTDKFCNGDIGTVVSSTERTVGINFYGVTVNVSKADIKNGDIVLAYAITIHKMQGSECDNIKIFIPAESTNFIDISLMYTAVTRAKNKVGLYYYS